MLFKPPKNFENPN